MIPFVVGGGVVGFLLTPARDLALTVWHALHHEGDLAWLLTRPLQ